MKKEKYDLGGEKTMITKQLQNNATILKHDVNIQENPITNNVVVDDT